MDIEVLFWILLWVFIQVFPSSRDWDLKHTKSPNPVRITINHNLLFAVIFGLSFLWIIFWGDSKVKPIAVGYGLGTLIYGVPLLSFPSQETFKQ